MSYLYCIVCSPPIVSFPSPHIWQRGFVKKPLVLYPDFEQCSFKCFCSFYSWSQRESNFSIPPNFLEFPILKRKPAIVLRSRRRQRGAQRKRQKRRKAQKLWVLSFSDCSHIPNRCGGCETWSQVSWRVTGFRNTEITFTLNVFLFSHISLSYLNVTHCKL